MYSCDMAAGSCCPQVLGWLICAAADDAGAAAAALGGAPGWGPPIGRLFAYVAHVVLAPLFLEGNAQLLALRVGHAGGHVSHFILQKGSTWSGHPVTGSAVSHPG